MIGTAVVLGLETGLTSTVTVVVFWLVWAVVVTELLSDTDMLVGVWFPLTVVLPGVSVV